VQINRLVSVQLETTQPSSPGDMATSILQNERNRTKAARLKRKRSSSPENIRQQPTPRGSMQHDSPMPVLDELNTPNPFNLHAISNAPQQWRDALTESFSWTDVHPAEEGFRPFREALCSGRLKPAPKINPATDHVDINKAYVFHGGPFVKVKTGELFEDAVFRHMMYPGNDRRKGGIRAVSQQAGALPDDDLEANTVKLIRYWADPDPKNNVYAVDITGVQADIAMLPSSKIIDQMQVNKKQLEISSANITPKYTVVDLHNGPHLFPYIFYLHANKSQTTQTTSSPSATAQNSGSSSPPLPPT
jgi:hypothetical protein